MLFFDKLVGVLDVYIVSDKINFVYGCMDNLDRYLEDKDIVIMFLVIEMGISIDKFYFDEVYGFG